MIDVPLLVQLPKIDESDKETPVMDILDLLHREIYRESVAHSPRVPGSVEAMKLAIEEIERQHGALKAVVDWAEELRYFSEPGTQMAPVFQRAKEVIEGKK